MNPHHSRGRSAGFQQGKRRSLGTRKRAALRRVRASQGAPGASSRREEVGAEAGSTAPAARRGVGGAEQPGPPLLLSPLRRQAQRSPPPAGRAFSISTLPGGKKTRRPRTTNPETYVLPRPRKPDAQLQQHWGNLLFSLSERLFPCQSQTLCWESRST